MFITEDIKYLGVNDHDIDLFEGQYTVPNGMAYNSYLICDDKNIVIDSVETRFSDEWLSNIEKELGSKSPDYLLVQHMEPDHSSSIKAFMTKYPDSVLVANQKAFAMIDNFYGAGLCKNTLAIADGDTLSLGAHELQFFAAPMVHWPEVMMTYDKKDKVFFSADAFGKFGALDIEEDWLSEARRYYIGIVGKYGAQVVQLYNKIKDLDIKTICSLHGPVLKENLGYYIDKYVTWATYAPEDKGVCIAYTSIYGNTKLAAIKLFDALKAKGVNAVIFDLARDDMFEAVAQAFRFDKLVLATTTYNGDVFPFMKTYINHLVERFYQKRTVALIENGSWGPIAAKKMEGYLASAKDINILEQKVSIKSSLNDASSAQLDALIEELAK